MILHRVKGIIKRKNDLSSLIQKKILKFSEVRKRFGISKAAIFRWSKNLEPKSIGIKMEQNRRCGAQEGY